MVRMRLPHGSECDRARAVASHGLDHEVAELDLAALRVHLRACAECTRIVSAMEHVTERVRATPKLEPSRSLQPAGTPVKPARRRAGRSAWRLLGVGAAVAAAAAGAMVASHVRPEPAAPSHAIVVAELAPLDHQFRLIRAGQLQLRLPPPPMRSPHARGVVV
jgi:ferric-dicitrate binding protein FerR (iron transport regulator)